MKQSRMIALGLTAATLVGVALTYRKPAPATAPNQNPLPSTDPLVVKAQELITQLEGSVDHAAAASQLETAANLAQGVSPQAADLLRKAAARHKGKVPAASTPKGALGGALIP